MAGVTDVVFRQLCKELGADVMVTEFVSAEGIMQRDEYTRKYTDFSEEQRPVGIQLFGADGARMGEAARRRAREIFDWKNIFGRYEELWDAQTKMRLTHAPRAIPRIGWTVPPSLLWRVGATRKRRRTTSNCSGSWRWWGSRRPCCQARQKSARCPTRPQAARDLQANWLPG